MDIVGDGKFRYKVIETWPHIPKYWKLGMVSDGAVNSQNEIYLFSRGSHPITIWNTHGDFISSWGEGDFSANPHGIFISTNDNVWLVDRDYHIATEYTPGGSLLQTLGTKLAPSPSFLGEPFNMPSGISVAPDGHIFVSDGYGGHRVHKFDSTGNLILSWGKQGSGNGEFALLHNIWVNSLNQVMICDRENNRVQIFDTEGQYLDQWTDLSSPGDIWIRNDVVYIVEQGSPCGVSIWTLGGELITRWRGYGIADGHGIFIDHLDNIYVTEIGQAQRIQKYEKI